MVNSVHLQKLLEDIKSWNEWRATNPAVVPDLRRIKLSLGQRQFGTVNGGPINLRAAILSGADLRNATLIDADLSAADLVEVDLTNARLNNASLRDADLTDAVFGAADLADAELTHATLTGADLSQTLNLRQEQIDSTKGDESTRLPPGISRPQGWSSKNSRDDRSCPHEADNVEDGSSGESDPYVILGVPRGAAPDIVHASYRAKAKIVHPDRNGGDPAATAEFHRLTKAYTILRDPLTRRRYDAGEMDCDGAATEAYLYDNGHRKVIKMAASFAVIGFMATFLLAGLGLLSFSDHQREETGITDFEVKRPVGADHAAADRFSGGKPELGPHSNNERQAGALETGKTLSSAKGIVRATVPDTARKEEQGAAVPAQAQQIIESAKGIPTAFPAAEERAIVANAEPNAAKDALVPPAISEQQDVPSVKGTEAPEFHCPPDATALKGLSSSERASMEIKCPTIVRRSRNSVSPTVRHLPKPQLREERKNSVSKVTSRQGSTRVSDILAGGF